MAVKRWEYLTRSAGRGILDQGDLNDLGLDGWELVLLREGHETDQLVFKRPADGKKEASRG